MNEVHNILIGFELNDEGSQLCYYDRKTAEPVSVPSKVGTNMFVFPTLLCKMAGKDEWHFGIEADYFGRQSDGILIEGLCDLLKSSDSLVVDGCEMHPGELLAIYIRLALSLTGVRNLLRNIGFLTLTTRSLDRIFVENVREAFEILGLSRDQYAVLDQMESGFNYIYSQKKEITSRKIAIFHFEQMEDPSGTGLFHDMKVSYTSYEANHATRPYLVRSEKAPAISLPENKEERDATLVSYIEEKMGMQLFSAIYLTGEGFDTSWAKKSVALLCRGNRHVFSGQNLYVRGACYASLNKKESHHLRSYLYLGDDLVRTNIGMEMIVRGNPSNYPLISAGMNWFDAEKSCRIILDGRDYLAFSINSMDGRVRKMYRMELPGLPKRPNRTTRLELSVSCPGPKECIVKVKDLGFGEFFESSGLTWQDSLPLY